MKSENRIIGWMPLVMSLMLLGCAKDGTGGANGGDQQVEVVNVRFAFSMVPQHRSHKATTRMDSAIVNPTTLGDGLEDARMLCFNGVPSDRSACRWERPISAFTVMPQRLPALMRTA